MHSMLLVVEKPPAGTSAEYAWRPFLDTAAQIVGTIPEVSTLGENFWLIPVQHALPALAQIWRAAQGTPAQFDYQVLFLADEPQWLRSSTGTSESHA